MEYQKLLLIVPEISFQMMIKGIYTKTNTGFKTLN